MFRYLTFALLLTGCAQTQPLGLDTADGRAALNGRAIGHGATLQLTSAERLQVHGLHVAHDVTTWIDPETRAAHSVPTDSVESVLFRDRASGAFKGAAVAGIAGALVGYYATQNARGIGVVPGSGALLLAPPSALVGLMVGSESGDLTVYRRTEAVGLLDAQRARQ